MSWGKIKPKLYVIIVFLVVVFGVIAIAKAATYKGVMSGFGGLVYIFDHNGRTIHCLEPKAGDKVAFCKELDGTEFQCDVESPADGFISGCT